MEDACEIKHQAKANCCAFTSAEQDDKLSEWIGRFFWNIWLMLPLMCCAALTGEEII